MTLPLNMPWNLATTRWASLINPVLNNQINQGLLISNIPLTAGNNVINHTLARTQRGWILTDQTAASQIYRSAAYNNLTLTLNASAPTTISLWVF